MNWLNFLRKGTTENPAAMEQPQLEIPLFPLSGVLFPGGVLLLKVFEQRYLDMAAACMKNSSPFGVCLIASGQEVGETCLLYTSRCV